MMGSVIEERLLTPVTRACDVLVAGGGIAGVAAALTAARNGAETLLIEREYLLGGLATLGLVTIYLPLCDGRGRQVTFGVAEELLRLAIAHGAEATPEGWLRGEKQDEQTPRFEARFNPHLLALEMERLLLENGVEILYGATVRGAVAQGQKIDAAIIESKSGRFAVRAKAFIDCTGDVDLCALVGEETAVYKMGNTPAAWHYRIADGRPSLILRGAADEPAGAVSAVKPLTDERFTGLDVWEVSRLTRFCHNRILREAVGELREHPDHVPLTLPAIPQLRMTRRLEGLYTMKASDMGADFPDAVGFVGSWRERGPVFAVPFRALVGRKYTNLLAAGRAISASDDLWDLTRVIPACALTGEAAGEAAAVAGNFHTLNIERLSVHRRAKSC